MDECLDPDPNQTSILKLKSTVFLLPSSMFAVGNVIEYKPAEPPDNIIFTYKIHIMLKIFRVLTYICTKQNAVLYSNIKGLVGINLIT